MDIKYTVHRARASNRKTHVTISRSGQSLPAFATLDYFEVTLIDEAGQHGTLMFRFDTPEERQWAADTFREGESYTVHLPDQAAVAAAA